MFEGYYGRRRLKTTLAIVVGGLIVLALLYRRKSQILVENRSSSSGYFRSESFSTVSSNAPLNPNQTASSITEPKEEGFLSNIEFSNSPYLSIESLKAHHAIPIMVLSKAVSIEVRDAIRRTWGFNRRYLNDTLQLKVLFLVGTDDFMTQRTRMEQVVFDDVIQVNIPDMYSFVAYKELSAMLWVRKHLPDTKFYLKTEDHVILNTKVLVDKFLPIIESVSSERLIIGWFGSEHSVQRGTYQKFVDALVPPTSTELHYAMSLLYAVTASSADLMLAALRQVELIEYPGDPFVTGILRDVAHVKITNLAKTSEDLKYELANGKCKDAFEKNLKLLICTTSLHTGSTQSMIEYFDGWNVLIGQKWTNEPLDVVVLFFFNKKPQPRLLSISSAGEHDRCRIEVPSKTSRRFSNDPTDTRTLFVRFFLSLSFSLDQLAERISWIIINVLARRSILFRSLIGKRKSSHGVSCSSHDSSHPPATYLR